MLGWLALGDVHPLVKQLSEFSLKASMLVHHKVKKSEKRNIVWQAAPASRSGGWRSSTSAMPIVLLHACLDLSHEHCCIAHLSVFGLTLLQAAQVLVRKLVE